MHRMHVEATLPVFPGFLSFFPSFSLSGSLSGEHSAIMQRKEGERGERRERETERALSHFDAGAVNELLRETGRHTVYVLLCVVTDIELVHVLGLCTYKYENSTMCLTLSIWV